MGIFEMSKELDISINPLSLGLTRESKNVFETTYFGSFLKNFCFSIGSDAKSLHSFEQHPLNFFEHFLH